jgi:hypothetical protein
MDGKAVFNAETQRNDKKKNSESLRLCGVLIFLPYTHSEFALNTLLFKFFDVI